MKIVTDTISLAELAAMAQSSFGNLVKAVVDVEKGIMAVDAQLHADEEAELLKDGSRQENLWGVNLYPGKTGEGFMEFDSMINIRPSQNNLSRGVESEAIRERVREIVGGLTTE